MRSLRIAFLLLATCSVPAEVYKHLGDGGTSPDAIGTGSGAVAAVAPAELGAADQLVVPYRTTVTLTAIALRGSTFAGWSGACGGNGTCAVTMDRARDVVATFTREDEPLAAPIADDVIDGVADVAGAQTLTVRMAGTGDGRVTSALATAP